MARKPGSDERQTDFFGAPAAPPEKTRDLPAPRPKPSSVTIIAPAKERLEPVAVSLDIPEDGGIEAEFTRMSPAEMRNLVATLPDAVLAQLTLAATRQLRRRLERDSRCGGSKKSSTVLNRAAQQLIAELGGQNGEHDY